MVVHLPILFLGDILPGLFSLSLMWWLYRAVRTRGWSAYISAALGGVANVVAIWFVWCWSYWGFTDAAWVFQLGPMGILDVIVEASKEMSFTIRTDKDVLTGSSGLELGGTILLWFWGAEALLFDLFPFFALLPAPRETKSSIDQSESHHRLAANLADTTSEFGAFSTTVIFGLLRGILGTLIKFGIVAIAIYIITEFF